MKNALWNLLLLSQPWAAFGFTKGVFLVNLFHEILKVTHNQSTVVEKVLWFFTWVKPAIPQC